MVILRPWDLRRKATEADVIPLPIPEITPPETNIYLDISSIGLRLLNTLQP
jgi:hypothetical protein